MSYAKISAKARSELISALFLAFVWGQAAYSQSILPARPDAPGGGNPFEGLGRPDDPNPSRVQKAKDSTTDTAGDANLSPAPVTKSGDIVGSKKKAKQAPHLVPPPPPVVTEMVAVGDDKNPMKQAIHAIKQKEYEKARSLLSEIIKLDPENLKAVYLEAVVCVHKKEYLSAEEKYRRILDLSKDDELKKLAQAGLEKLSDIPGDRPSGESP